MKFPQKNCMTRFMLSAIKTYFKGVAIKARIRQTDQWNTMVSPEVDLFIY